MNMGRMMESEPRLKRMGLRPHVIGAKNNFVGQPPAVLFLVLYLMLGSLA